MEQVIFLDRDGTLNEEVHYLYRPKDLRILPGVAEAIRLWKGQGFKIVVVTNQAGVARGYYQEEDVKALHLYMNELLCPQGAEIDHFFYCPHHPQHGIGAYKTECRCRKPEPGLLAMAEQYYDIDKSRSWMIGDKLIDVQAGVNYGVKTVLVATGYGARERVRLEQQQKSQIQQRDRVQQQGQAQQEVYPYDYYAETLADAARAIVEWGAEAGRKEN